MVEIENDYKMHLNVDFTFEDGKWYVGLHIMCESACWTRATCYSLERRVSGRVSTRLVPLFRKLF